MGLSKSTHADLQRELKQLRRERVHVDETIAALEAILSRATSSGGLPAEPAARDARDTLPPRQASTGARKRRKAGSGTLVVAELVKRAGKPVTPRDIASLATESGKRISYDAIYSALRKSPRFVKKGSKWWVRDHDILSAPAPAPAPAPVSPVSPPPDEAMST